MQSSLQFLDYYSASFETATDKACPITDIEWLRAKAQQHRDNVNGLKRQLAGWDDQASICSAGTLSIYAPSRGFWPSEG